MHREVFINMENEVFNGNTLDIGFSNYGIVYNLYKRYNDDAAIEYISGRGEKNKIEKNIYDNCIIFFSLKDIWSKLGRMRLLSEISKYLKQDGVLYIWDIDKHYGKKIDLRLKVLLPGRVLKKIDIKDINFLKDASASSTQKLVQRYFDIIDLKCSDDIYCIKAKAKGRTLDESNTNRNQLKIYSQQFSNKVLKGIHERFKLSNRT